MRCACVHINVCACVCVSACVRLQGVLVARHCPGLFSPQLCQKHVGWSNTPASHGVKSLVLCTSLSLGLSMLNQTCSLSCREQLHDKNYTTYNHFRDVFHASYFPTKLLPKQPQNTWTSAVPILNRQVLSWWCSVNAPELLQNYSLSLVSRPQTGPQYAIAFIVCVLVVVPRAGLSLWCRVKLENVVVILPGSSAVKIL